MKLKIPCLWLFLSLSIISLQAQVKIGDNPTQISPFSLLELESGTKGLLLPRMSSETRDEVFNQDTPEGMFIFNTDTQMIQYFYYPLNITTGKKAQEKTWNTAGEEIYSVKAPENPNPGDLFYNQSTKILYIWDSKEALWIPINTRGGISDSEVGIQDPTVTGTGTNTQITGNLQEVITGRGAPLSSTLSDASLGLLYADLDSGNLYLATDRNNDGTAETWVRVNGSKGGGGQDLPDLREFKDLLDLPDLREFKDLLEFRDFRDFREFREFREFRDLQDWTPKPWLLMMLLLLLRKQPLPWTTVRR